MIEIMTNLVIRQAQMIALAEACELAWLHKEIERLYPAECAALGTGELRRFVPEGVRRAKTLGFSSPDSLSYLALELCFGERFVDDPMQSWAREAMEGDAETRMERLRSAAIFRLADLAEHERRQENAWREAAEVDETPEDLESVE